MALPEKEQPIILRMAKERKEAQDKIVTGISEKPNEVLNIEEEKKEPEEKDKDKEGNSGSGSGSSSGETKSISFNLGNEDEKK